MDCRQGSGQGCRRALPARRRDDRRSARANQEAGVREIDDLADRHRGRGRAVPGGAEPGAAAGAQRAVPLHSETEAVDRLGLRKLHLPWALFAVATIALLVLTFVHFRQPLPEAPLRKFGFSPPEVGTKRERSPNACNTSFGPALSPNGRLVALSANERSNPRRVGVRYRARGAASLDLVPRARWFLGLVAWRRAGCILFPSSRQRRHFPAAGRWERGGQATVRQSGLRLGIRLVPRRKSENR